MRDSLNPNTKPVVFSPDPFPSLPHHGSPLNDRTADVKAAHLTLEELRIRMDESPARWLHGWLSLSLLPYRTTPRKR